MIKRRGGLLPTAMYCC